MNEALINYGHIQFIDSLFGYLEVRQWAFDKMESSPVGSNLIDLKMHYYLYFANLFGAVDLVIDYLQNPTDKKYFEENIKKGFDNPNNYIYARELRNSIVHRGLDPSMSGTQIDNCVFPLCPSVVHNINGTKSYACDFSLLIDLARACDKATNIAILGVLEHEGLLVPQTYKLNDRFVEKVVEEIPHMPDCVKDLARQVLTEIDFERLTMEMATTRIQTLKSFLGKTEKR